MCLFLFISIPVADRSVRGVHYQFAYKRRTVALLLKCKFSSSLYH